eukprot:CAMPEP_0182927532 /NCGR_PEP_ID=MMETSP0105_2-20130417/13830_1 /TAXON_ID=81532 ORGANISM="Acanthoeca-like sp., Strain 10tr" /NCGR_SAMPLE_ID=MMETSP0105_2 /ASSEMBLY_ACC=CAM_ASM_000205 /LENGTH=554 /DNA_ID=CAMNT_0025065481 /DNA_START=45 /DNA_END=1709 /DNA_ORIENTATION=+
MSKVADAQDGRVPVGTADLSDFLVPVGSRRNGARARRASGRAASERSEFTVPIAQSGSKFTEQQGYNALTDPALKNFWKKSVARKVVRRNGLVTADFRVLDTTKKAHLRRHYAVLESEAQPRQERAQRAKLQATRSLIDAKLAEKEAAKIKYARMREQQEAARELLEKKVEMNRVGVAEAAPSEQTRIYLDERKRDFEIFKEKEEMQRIELQAEQRLKAAKKDREIRLENDQRRLALEERVADDEAQLAKVKEAIVNVKVATEKRRVAIREAEARRCEKVKAEAAAFKVLLEKTEEGRKAAREREAAERAAKRADERRRWVAKQKELEEEKARLEKERRDRERAEMAALRREQHREEQERRRKEAEEKARRREAKEAFQREREEEARQNRERVALEKMKRDAVLAKRKRDQLAKREQMKAKMAEEKRIRQESIDRAKAEIEKQRAFEMEMDMQIQQDIIAANEKAFKEEQRRLWEEALLEEKRAEAAKAEAAKKAKRDAEAKAAEEAAEERRMALLARKEEAEKKAKEKVRREKLQRAKEESERRIRYMNKFGC